MEADGTTAPADSTDKSQARHQRLRHRNRGQRPRPMWQEPLRGALYAAGGSAITLLTSWLQHWL